MNANWRGVRSSESTELRFECLYEQHFERVAGYVLARVDRDSAADAVARTFEIAWRRLADVPAEPGPWLLAVARRVLAEQRRADGRRDRLCERLAGAVVEEGDDHAEVAVHREALLAAIMGLTLSQREALLLVASDGLSEREAAVVLGCSRGAVALRVHRARKHLRGVLERADREHALFRPGSPGSGPTRSIHRSSQETT
jgi:RNA polymerase sigma-70 factor (ECF subfamily)